ncbi:hypothetical protein G6F59_015586 [Rhizopus arrhizus]|nr:hypothetical protein G6F59_015586 [Rhizopus arrhizus]
MQQLVTGVGFGKPLRIGAHLRQAAAGGRAAAGGWARMQAAGGAGQLGLCDVIAVRVGVPAPHVFGQRLLALAGIQAGNAEQASTAEQEAGRELAQARERFARYMEVPKSERGHALAVILQGRFTEYASLLDTLSAAIKERT